jgi:lipoate-protein ligase A
MKYIESPSHDAYFNMALEEYIFDRLPRSDEYFMLWRNDNAVVVGAYQNTAEEINAQYVREHGISVVRRLSGGGTMYQDLGNLNFTFVVNQDKARNLDFSIFIDPVVRALAQMGIKAEHNSRNDITIEGKKISGNSQYNKWGRTMHHGTLLFNSDLSVVGKALNVKADKIASKSIKSVRSRVTNIIDYLNESITMDDFKRMLLKKMFSANALVPYSLSEEDIKEVMLLRNGKYASWEWNYGKNPPYNVRKERRFEFGGVTLMMEVKHGAIQTIGFSGDFFGNGNIEELSSALLGITLHAQAIDNALSSIDVGYYIRGIDRNTLRDMILY